MPIDPIKTLDIEILRAQLVREFNSEDIAQEALCLGLEKREKGKLGGTLDDFRAWTWATATNLHSSEMRHRRRFRIESRQSDGYGNDEKEHSDGITGSLPGGMDPEILTVNRELLGAFRGMYPEVVEYFELTGTEKKAFQASGAPWERVKRSISRLRDKGIRDFLGELEEAR